MVRDVEETQEHIFKCEALSSDEILVNTTQYEKLLGSHTIKQNTISAIMKERLNIIKEIINSKVSPVFSLGPSDPM